MAELRTIAGALGRMAAGRSSRNRILQASWSAAAATLRSFGRIVHLLFLEVTGFLFLCFGVVGAGAAVREYHKYQAGVIGPGKPFLAGAFAIMFFWFAASSFWRARHK